MVFDIVPVTSPRPTDCGATCLKMLLSYYGIDVDIETLIKECNTRIIGCSAKDLIRVGKAHGLDARAYKCPSTDVLTQDRPAIVWWMYHHWVIYGGVDDEGKVVIYNPDRGRYRISKGTFASFYTEVELTNGEPEDLPAGDAE